MSEGSDRLHFDGVHFIEAVVQDTRGVDDLVSEIFVFGMADVQGLGCKGIRLDLDVGFADGVDE